jgi:rhodanese-related sulfurtransferase
MVVKEISPKEVKARLDAGEKITILDVREDWEVHTCSVQGTLNIAMQHIPTRKGELPKDQPLVVMCHHGRRSEQVAMWLQMQGFSDVFSMTGGIDQWAVEVDPSVGKY